MCLSKVKIAKCLGIGCLLCCASKVVFLVIGASLFGSDQGLLPLILVSFSFGLLGIAYYMIQNREAQAKLRPTEA